MQLPDYLFNYDNFPDITSESGMFFGNQTNKRQ